MIFLTRVEGQDHQRHPAPRHTFATIVTVQDLLGHTQVTTTQGYTRVSNQKVRNDYFKGMEKILATTQGE